MESALIVPAFVAGVLTFLAPCTLPLVPGYLAFIGGASLEDLRDPAKARAARRRIFLNGVAFVTGFSVIFIAFGVLVGFVGGMLLASYRVWLGRVGGVFVILFGLFMLGILRIPFLSEERRIRAPSLFQRGQPLNSLILGAAFALGWTPCVGPVLGSVLLLASASTTALAGGFLLAVFSIGLALPFLIIALGIGNASTYIHRFGRYLNAMTVVGGIFLVALGALLLTGNLGVLISLGYQVFDFIDYERLLEYL